MLKATTSALNSAEVYRAAECPGSAVVRLAESPPPHPAQWWGIMGHRFLEYCKTRGKDAALDYVRRKFTRGYKMCLAINPDRLPDGEPEVGLAHSPAEREARRLNYGAWAWPETELFGGRNDVLDLSGQHFPGPWIHDYKFGPGPHDPITDQMIGLAAAAADLEGWNGGARTTAWAVEATGLLTPYHYEASAGELQEFRELAEKTRLIVLEQRRALAEDGEPPSYKAGEHCKWCKLKGICPATRT